MTQNNYTTEQIRARVSVSRVVSYYIQLNKKGNEYVGLCPFHNDGKASLTVNDQKQLYYCFPCKDGGDIFDFVMKVDGVSFPDAKQIIIELAGW